jgi:hypothetical protein
MQLDKARCARSPVVTPPVLVLFFCGSHFALQRKTPEGELSMNTLKAPLASRRFIIRGRGLTLTRIGGLLALVIPGGGFILGLHVLRGRPEFAFLEHPGAWPLELWVIAIGGTFATLAGFGDFVWHVRGLREVSRKEERGEVIALALGGAPLFAFMAIASLSSDPRPFLIPALVTTMFTVACVCHDEFVYHRHACGRVESFFHHVLIFGNAVAFLAWFHWAFVRDRLAV